MSISGSVHTAMEVTGVTSTAARRVYAQVAENVKDAFFVNVSSLSLVWYASIPL